MTTANRHHYVLLLCKFLLKTGVSNNLSAFVAGFHSVSPLKLLKGLTPRLLAQQLCGKRKISDQDWKDLKNCCVISAHSGADVDSLSNSHSLRIKRCVGNFFDMLVLPAFRRQSVRRDLLMFWIGGASVPAGGFSELQPPIALAVIDHPASSSSTSIVEETRLPQSHVCFNRLDLPLYDDIVVMSEKVLQAVSMSGHAISLE